VSDRLKSAAEPIGEGGLQYHIRVKPGDVSRYILLPGDPGRVDLIAGELDDARFIAWHREFKTYTGFYKGVRVSVTSTGIGSPSTAIAVEELLRVGGDTFIRVGTMGAIQSWIRPGDLVIGVASVSMDGTSRQYSIEGYPSYASYDVVSALIEAADVLGYRYHVGVIASTDSFYLGQGRPGYRGLMTPRHSSIIPTLSSLGVLGFEMEASTIYTLSSIYGARAGCVCAAVANRVTDEFVIDAGVREASKTALEAVRILSRWDDEARRMGRRWIYPGLVSGIYR